VVKLVLLFKHPHDIDAFEQHYIDNLALLEQLPGIIRRQANLVLGSPLGKSPYYRILELYFDNFEALDAAMTSNSGVQAGQQLMETVGHLVESIFVDVFEDGPPENSA
jgi:uncharacterized protein (TIGR02118 family)